LKRERRLDKGDNGERKPDILKNCKEEGAPEGPAALGCSENKTGGYDRVELDSGGRGRPVKKRRKSSFDIQRGGIGDPGPPFYRGRR